MPKGDTRPQRNADSLRCFRDSWALTPASSFSPRAALSHSLWPSFSSWRRSPPPCAPPLKMLLSLPRILHLPHSTTNAPTYILLLFPKYLPHLSRPFPLQLIILTYLGLYFVPPYYESRLIDLLYFYLPTRL